MPKIGSVKVSYRRSVQPRQYESAEASVTLDLIFAEGEDPNVDEVITGELDRVQAHVERQLGISEKPAPKTSPTKPAAAPKATAPASPPAGTRESGSKPPSTNGTTATKPAFPSKPAAPKPAAPKPAAKPAAPKAKEPAKLTKNDAMKAIAATMTALQKKGIADGQKRIEKKVLGYLPDDKPPISYTRIPEDSIGDFIKDVEELADVEQ